MFFVPAHHAGAAADESGNLLGRASNGHKGAPDAPLKETTLDPAVADLHYRGYSVMHMPVGAGAPEVPDYNQIEGTKQRWRDLIGYYTRFGDVRELLKKIDDRYVIMNSGDEMTFRFAEQPPPAAGWVRDFVIMGDGWIKDGDYNSTFSKTVLASALSRQERIHNAARARSRMNGPIATIPKTGRRITRAT